MLLNCETANQIRAQHWAALWNSQSEQSSTLSRTVKQPIRGAQRWATLWNSQSEQSSTLSHTVKQPIRAELNIEPHCETANQNRAHHWAALWNSQSSRAHHWAALWNSQSEQSSSLSRTVKQPIRAELNIEPHCETANQSRAQHWAALWNQSSRAHHWAALWNSQSEQSSTLSRTVKQPIRA